ncbi:MAG TPA: hypothetical protein VN823_28340 [Stellaceae bacterium]|nr:hypothetical protein [Stellaceae bacterium]
MSQTKELFRKSALERLASPERHDQLVTLASPRPWSALLGSCVLIALAALWAVLATS